jgi:hypothetical protein
MSRLRLFALPASLALVLAACGPVRPIRVNSDPNQEALDRLHDQVERDDVEAFIAAHPELDARTKRELRDGTISRREAAERMKRRK